MTTSSSALVRLVAVSVIGTLVVAVSWALRSGDGGASAAQRESVGSGWQARSDAAAGGLQVLGGDLRAGEPSVQRFVHDRVPFTVSVGPAAPGRNLVRVDTTGHAHGSPGAPGVRRYDGAGSRPRPPPGRCRRALGHGRPAPGRGHGARHARAGPPDPVRGGHRPGARRLVVLGRRGRARVPGRGHWTSRGRWSPRGRQLPLRRAHHRGPRGGHLHGRPARSSAGCASSPSTATRRPGAGRHGRPRRGSPSTAASTSSARRRRPRPGAPYSTSPGGPPRRSSSPP